MINVVLVIKVGDKTRENAISDAALADLHEISNHNSTVIVHGGGNTVTAIAEKLGIKQEFITSPEGFRSRHTDAETMQVYTMVMAGKVNKEIVLRLQGNKIPAIGLSGIDGGLIRAERKRKLIVTDERGRRRVIDGGYTGRVTRTDGALLRRLMDGGYVPVIAPIALGGENEPLNIDGDRTAANVAGALQADTLLLVTDVGGVSIQSRLARRLSASDAKNNLSNLGPGMITKVYAALEALSSGVGRVVIASGQGATPYSSALQEQNGTVIVA